VALANYTEIVEGRGGPHGGVFLDITSRDKTYILEKLPRMYRQFMESQMLDISHEPMEVAPTAHYTMGGVVIAEPETQATAVAGLYAVGEVTTGLHGANRLGGNSLAEIIVFGKRAGEAAATYSQVVEIRVRSKVAMRQAHDDLDGLLREGDELARPLQRALRDTLWECCGVMRTEERLQRGLARVSELRDAASHVDVRPSAEGYQDLALALDLRASLVTAEATLLGAIERRESRGAHQRSDYPALDPALALNFVAACDVSKGDRLTVTRSPVPAMPTELASWADTSPPDLSLTGRLLE